MCLVFNDQMKTVMEKPTDSLSFPERTQTVRDVQPSKDVTVCGVGEINVVLENESVWTQFHSVGTEMIITEQGRRMFPWCRFRLAGLQPKLCYSLLMDVVPVDDFRHKWNGETWEADGPGEPHVQGLPCFHPDSPALGQRWMDNPVSFYKVKLTHDTVDQDSCVALRPMHRYQPRLYILPYHQPAISLEDPQVQMFTFNQTEFYAVTSFQNPKMKQLKINCNPFMLAFRENAEKTLRHAVRDRCQSLSAVSHSLDGNSKDHTSTHTCAESQSDEEPVLSDRTGCFTTEDSEVSSDRPVSRTSGDSSQNVMSSSLQRQHKSVTLTSSRRSAACNTRGVGCRSRRLKKARKAKSKRWSNVKYARAAVHLGPVDTSMQPDLEDVDGVLFLSFGVKEALDVHVVNMRSSVEPSSSSSSLTHIHTENSQCDKEEQIISQQQHILLQHLKKLRNRQIIHPALQDVGLKLNLLDPAASIDLHYLGVSLTSPALSINNLQTSPDVPFVSRTRKTDDLTKIKGWKKNFQNTSGQNSVDSSVNLSAFFSDELEEYLESEAQQICQRAAAFATSSPSSVVYQLPDKSSSYVRTLDSVLQTRGVTAAPFTPSTDHGNPSNVLPSKTAVKMTPERSRQTPSVPVKNAQCSPQDRHPSTHSKPEAGVRGGGHLGCCSSINVSTSAKTLLKLLEQEQEAVDHGQSRTFVTTARAEFALISLVTSGKSRKSAFRKSPVSQNVCGHDFCRLGCVCDSLNRKIRGPTHCRRLQCMFGCDCFKHKVFLIHPPERIQTHVGKMPLMAFPVDPQLNHRPDPAPIITRLWNRRSDDHDTELIFTPTATSNPPALQKNTSSRVYVPRPNPVVQEMEKDPVYRYLESKMTCARVREYNSNPPPQFHIIPVPKKKCNNEISRPSSALTHLMSQSPDKNAAASEGPEGTKVLEIISECNWEAQRTRVLKELFRCINMNLLSSSLLINIYKVDLLSTTLKKDNGHCTLSYKVCISRSEKSRRTDDPKNKVNNQKITKEQIHKNSFDCQVYESSYNDEIHIRSVDNVTKSLENFPLLSCVIPAGCLKAVKMSACPRPIQVNGKTYTKAKLLLGQMGSLHPANRLAAYVTGRMKPMSQSWGKVVSETLPDRTPASLKKTQPPVIPRALRHTIHSPLNVFNPVSIPNLSSTPSSSNPIPAVPNNIPLNPDAPAKPNIVIPAAALPPGQQVVLQPVSGVSGANICQFNGQLIQLFPLPAVLPIHLQTKEKAQTPSVQLPQMIKTTAEPHEAASFPKRHPFIAPKILFLPGPTDFSFTSGTTAHGSHNSSSGKTGTLSFRICPPAQGQTDAGESASTILLPGGYRLIKLPVDDKSSEKSLSAVIPSASHVMTKCIAHDSNRETKSDSFPVADAEQKDQTIHMMSSRRVDVTYEDSMTHKSTLVHIKTEPDEIPTQPPFISDTPEDCLQDLIKTEPYDSSSTHHSLLKQEPLCSSSRKPVDNPENTEESNNSEDDFVVIKIETSDKTSEIGQLSDLISKNTGNPETDSPSTCLKIQPAENNSPFLKTEQTGAVFKQPVSVTSSLNNAQQHPSEGKTCSWPYRLMQKALNSCEEDTEEQRHDCEAELNLSINHSDDIFKCFSEDWTSEDSCSEEDINIETIEKNTGKMNMSQLRTKSRRKSKKAEQHKLGEESQDDAVEHESDLCLYKRAWHLNLSARKRKRCVELRQRFDLLKRILNTKDHNISVQDVLLQACDMIGALEHCSRSLTEKKKSLIQKHYRYISLVSQLSAGTVLQHTGQEKKSTIETSSHKHSVAKRPTGLPKIVLQALSKI